MDMCIMELQILLKLFKSKVRVWVAKILKVGHGLFKIKGMATKRLYEYRDNWCNVCYRPECGAGIIEK